ncbi:N-acetylglucosamine/diacetylchitobiose ABC transporter substrate-binding protein [Virgisporangium ochraceum]|uniref:Carbohydrate ABC transporter, N-acetylglucosamine/diacetylchitobiose-binding protein n=1 Tax=Virgisporangium ochraceum TaxID=65505 RepID=A0A8J3ZMP3_9ACTN|nr:N-acetylglucosamine/diacetylchitobiose ABC transporter substrate-binding protein [Virgisporangium ochraceum]GIJ66872.1 carbohydrate ABC transporter, N-acetylglucosamine/diacetylchitobiose-binding protein [Virgisporangium ochraceum]
MSTRRTLLAGASALALTACATNAGKSGDGDSNGGGRKGAATNENPLGVASDAPLEVVIFKGGYGDQYAQQARDGYRQRHAKATIDYKAIQRVGEVLQPRFISDSPPDVVDNTGAGRLDLATLVTSNKLRDLGELLDAPSLDDPTVKVRDTLLPGVVDEGTYDGKPLVLNYASVLWGIWYSKSLFAQRGWTYPKTWADMLTLCGEMKKAGVAPWTWQGKYPEYMNDPLISLAAKAGGQDLVKSVDNLEPNAWKSPAMTAAVTAVHELVARGYVMTGSEGLSHTEAQNAWSKGQAAFIPCGSWLESEQEQVTTPGFDMVMATVPELTGSDKLPAGAVMSASSESFLVPARAKNGQGGLEYLRILLSRDIAKGFAQNSKALPVVKGATDGLTLSSGLSSVAGAAKSRDLFGYRFRTWYPALAKGLDDATGELMAGRATPAQWADRVQKAADDVAKDSSVTRRKR